MDQQQDRLEVAMIDVLEVTNVMNEYSDCYHYYAKLHVADCDTVCQSTSQYA